MAAKNTPLRVFLHCSDTPDTPKTDKKFFDHYGKDIIDYWHREENGWDEIGYHIVVRRTGVIEYGRDLDKVPAAQYGYNRNTLAICWVGRKHPTRDQVESLLKIYAWAWKKYDIDFNSWYGHYEVNSSKTCPGIDMVVIRKMLMYYHTALITEMS